jgi:hypothetical protein
MINPYNFVRSDKPMPRGKPNEHHRLSGRSGLIRCTLKTITPIFTPAFAARSQTSPSNLRFFRINNQPALPGSSLKGMVRSLAEAISNASSPFNDRVHPPCRSARELCPVCRLFGYLRGSEVHAGHVSISDALVEEGYELGNFITLKELSSPKPKRHLPFYEDAARERGRKFYYHQAHVQTTDDIPTENRPTFRNVRIEPLLKGVFHFTVRYWNIGDTELGLLLHALELPPELYHKLGMAKPLGLGTVRVDIVGFKDDNPMQTDPKSRYRRFEASGTEVSLQEGEGETVEQQQQRLRQCIEPLKTAYAHEYSKVLGVTPPADDLWALSAKNIEDLRVMLSLVDYSDDIRYPSYSWFDRHGSERLPTTQEVHDGERLPNN